MNQLAGSWTINLRSRMSFMICLFQGGLQKSSKQSRLLYVRNFLSHLLIKMFTNPVLFQRTNIMTVAILNSNAHSHVRRHNFYRDYSPCHKFFSLRYAIGLHKANHEDLVKFQNREDDHNYVSLSSRVQTFCSQLLRVFLPSCI